jgi:predicted nucleotidyltransferase/uncharacterized protein YutE (UPF0331/DUF86 family)
MNDSAEKTKKLKNYFQKRSDVVMAFLFGSRAKGGARDGSSDWDVAVYFTPLTQELEYEDSEREYPEEDNIWVDLSRMLETDDVDLLVLNRAPASIADTALRGEALVLKERGLWLKFMLVITGLAEDWRIFARDYTAIFERSGSLMPDDAERLDKTILFIKEAMTLYPYFAKFSRDDYINDIHKQLEMERWVENVMNATIDIAKTVLASSHKPRPPAYREIVAQGALILGQDEQAATCLEKWVRLRNILAHEYLDIKWKRISDFTTESEKYVREFVDRAKRFLVESDVIG